MNLSLWWNLFCTTKTQLHQIQQHIVSASRLSSIQLSLDLYYYTTVPQAQLYVTIKGFFGHASDIFVMHQDLDLYFEDSLALASIRYLIKGLTYNFSLHQMGNVEEVLSYLIKTCNYISCFILWAIVFKCRILSCTIISSAFCLIISLSFILLSHQRL